MQRHTPIPTSECVDTFPEQTCCPPPVCRPASVFCPPKTRRNTCMRLKYGMKEVGFLLSTWPCEPEVIPAHLHCWVVDIRRRGECAVRGRMKPIRADIDVLAQTFATNNIGLAATFHPFINGMVQRKSGSLVGIASVAGIRGLPGHGAYCASKAAVISYCESLRGDMRAATGRDGVKVITIAPGYVATPLTVSNTYSMPFILQPEEFAERAFQAIEAGVSYRVIPWQMGIVAKLLRLLPNWLFDKAVAGRGRKKRREAA